MNKGIQRWVRRGWLWGERSVERRGGQKSVSVLNFGNGGEIALRDEPEGSLGGGRGGDGINNVANPEKACYVFPAKRIFWSEGVPAERLRLERKRSTWTLEGGIVLKKILGRRNKKAVAVIEKEDAE